MLLTEALMNVISKCKRLEQARSGIAKPFVMVFVPLLDIVHRSCIVRVKRQEPLQTIVT